MPSQFCGQVQADPPPLEPTVMAMNIGVLGGSTAGGTGAVSIRPWSDSGFLRAAGAGAELGVFQQGSQV